MGHVSNKVQLIIKKLYYKKTKIILITFLGLLMAGCREDGKRSHRNDFLPPLKIEIPNEIKEDVELVALVKDSEVAINKFSDNMEYLILDMKPYLDKKDEQLSTFERLKLTKIVTKFVANSTKGALVLTKIATYSDKRAMTNNPLTEEQLKAIALVSDTFEKRMQQLDDKYQKISSRKNN